MAEAQENSLPEEQPCPICKYQVSYPICNCYCGQRICHYCFITASVCPKCSLLEIEVEPCPFRHYNLCPWWGVSSKLKSHLLEKHSSQLNVKEKQRLLEMSLPVGQPCPRCNCKMYFTIRECRCGQSICDTCFRTREVCPKCRLLKSGEEPCPFRKSDYCPWWGLRSKLKSHLMEKHSSNFYIKEERRFVSHNFKNSGYLYNTAVFHAYGQLFQLTWELDDLTEITRWIIQYMGSPEKAKRYSYTIEFSGETSFDDTSSSFVMKAPCESVPEIDYIFDETNCINIHRSFLEKFCEFNDNLVYKITIHYINSDSNDYINDIRYLFTDVCDTD